MRGGVEPAVRRILEAVRREGDAALRRLTRRFDGARRRSIEVTPRERRAAARQVDEVTLRALRTAARRIAAFARLQRRSIRPVRAAAGGVVLEQRLLPVETVGVYVPGGRYPLCSSVLMGAIPARVAGCRRVVLCTPPRRDGKVAPEVLAAAGVAGVDRVFAVGGAQAIAAMAYGTRSVPAVDLIVGPGNRYVAAAKAALVGRCGIDFVAGPSELLVIADRAADPQRVAWDLVGQAEHDPEARLFVVGLGRGVAGAIAGRARRLARTLPSPNREIAGAALARLRAVTAATPVAACRMANRVAPEHLSVQTTAPRRLLSRLTAYGSLFLGGGSAVALGDYVTGPNHTLPTSGAARHTGGLSVLRFLRAATVQEVRGSGARRLGPVAERLAAVEGLHAHRASVAIRLGRAEARAVLFDFDGVLVDSERQHWIAFRETLRPHGVVLSRALYDRRYLAFDDRSAIAAMLRDAGLAAVALPIDLLVWRKRALFRRMGGRAGAIDPRVAALVRSVAARVPIAVVSGAARREISDALRRARLAAEFRAIVAAEDVRRCKPDPEGYRLGLKRLGLKRPDGCLAIEDSPGGIAAARAAGLAVIGVAGSYPAATLRRAGAFRVETSLAGLTPDEILDRPR